MLTSGDKNKFRSKIHKEKIDEDSEEEDQKRERRQKKNQKTRHRSENSEEDSDRRDSKFTPRSKKSSVISSQTTIVKINSGSLKPPDMHVDMPQQDSTNNQSIPEFLRDPKYYRKGIEQTWEQDEAVVFPQIEEF